MLGRSNEFFGMGSSAEDNIKMHVVRHESTDVLETNMYKEAARRVIFANCFAGCEIDPKEVPNFNRNFYYN